MTMRLRIPAWKWVVITGVSFLIILSGFVVSQLPSWAADGLLHPARHHVKVGPPAGCDVRTFAGAGVTLRGWYCHAAGDTRGTIIYLHGIADNRTSGTGITARFLARGFDVVAYDSRGHGESDGDICTYGYFEKQDLHRVLDVINPRGIVLLGTSLGAAVALQEAANDSRVAAIVAAETFSDLRTIARERAPFFLSASRIRKAFLLAEQRGHFDVDVVSPVTAARRVAVPVLLIHGDLARDTTPDHSQRVFEALEGPKRLILVKGARHNESLNGTVWQNIDLWIDSALQLRAEAAGEVVARTGRGGAETRRQ